jgi:monofunctional biosynthetic peptidoglycan transglycosylase
VKNWTLLGSVVLAMGLFTSGAYVAIKAALAPLPGEWAVPVRLGPLELEAGVPSLIRLATSPWGGPLLDGQQFATSVGLVRFEWQTATRTLALHCDSCVVPAPGLGGERLRLEGVRVTVRRQFEQLSGEVTAGRVQGSWQGQMAHGELRLKLSVPATPLQDVYALFARDIPEVGRVTIRGGFSMSAELALPSGQLRADPRIHGVEVAGLDLETLARAGSSCSHGLKRSRLTPDSWLVRAAVAAEDQRFFEHAGYDLAELAAAMSRNHGAQRIERGASTLSQQVAKMLVTGEERTVARKLRELLYAVEMERVLGKARILRLYLDNAPWGAGLCGAEAASARYFGVRAHELTAPQAAWLAAMLHSPEAEERRWAAQGQINMGRAQWVLLGMRGLTRSDKLKLADEMATMPWPARWAQD